MEYSSTDTPVMSSNEAKLKLILDLLQQAYTDGEYPERDARIQQVWTAYTGAPFIRYKPAGTFLRGYPGQGKTTAFVAAASEVAHALGMRLVTQPDGTTPIDRDTLILHVIDLSGAVSNLDIQGLPKTQTAPDGTAHSTSVPQYAMAAMQKAGAGVLVFDDASNAHPSVQNRINNFLNDAGSQTIKLGSRALVGLTGNLGGDDGTHVNAASNATLTRVNTYIVEDSLGDWCDRTRARYRDPIGDAGVSRFLKQNPDLFNRPSGGRGTNPYPCPRTWSRGLEEHMRPMYAMIHGVLQQGGDAGKLEEIIQRHCRLLGGVVGMEAADKYATFTRLMANQAIPLAEKLLTQGHLSEQDIKHFRNLYGEGFSADSETFLARFTGVLCDKAASLMVQQYRADPEGFRRTTQGLMTGLFTLPETTSHLGWAGYDLATRIAQIAATPEIAYINPQNGTPIFKPEFLETFFTSINGHPDACAETENGKTIVEETLIAGMFGGETNDLGNIAAQSVQPAKPQTPGTQAPGMGG